MYLVQNPCLRFSGSLKGEIQPLRDRANLVACLVNKECHYKSEDECEHRET